MKTLQVHDGAVKMILFKARIPPSSGGEGGQK